MDTCRASHDDGQVGSAASLFLRLLPKPRDAEGAPVLHEAHFAVQFDAEHLQAQMSQATEPFTAAEGLASGSIALLDPDKRHFEIALRRGGGNGRRDPK